jgi:hypothetical protein
MLQPTGLVIPDLLGKHLYSTVASRVIHKQILVVLIFQKLRSYWTLRFLLHLLLRLLFLFLNLLPLLIFLLFFIKHTGLIQLFLFGRLEVSVLGSRCILGIVIRG